MKSPNATTSMKNLKMARSLIRYALNDLKNDDRVRNNGAPDALRSIEQAIADIEAQLETFGYPVDRSKP